MISKDPSFVKYSRPLCAVVALVWLLLAFSSFTSGDANAMVVGFLWLAGAVAFAIPAIFLKTGDNAEAANGEDAAE